MPSFNPKTKKLNYSQADETLVENCVVLLGIAVEYDSAAAVSAAEIEMQKFLSYVRNARKPKPLPAPKPAIAPRTKEVG